MKTPKQIIREAARRYMLGKHPDIMLHKKTSDDEVIYTDDGKGAWVPAILWVSLQSPPYHRNGRKIKPVKPPYKRSKPL